MRLPNAKETLLYFRCYQTTSLILTLCKTSNQRTDFYVESISATDRLLQLLPINFQDMPYLYNEYFTPSYHCVLDLSHSFHRYIFADKTFL